MEKGDQVIIEASKEALEDVGCDYLLENKGVITGFYPDCWVEVEVKTVFEGGKKFKVDLPKYFLKPIGVERKDS